MTCIIIIIIIIVIVIVIIMTCIPWTRPLVVVTTLSGPMSAQTLVRENKQTQSRFIIAEGDLGNILTWNFSSVNHTLPSMIIPATKLQHRVSASKKYVISRFLNFYKNVTFFGTWDWLSLTRIQYETFLLLESCTNLNIIYSQIFTFPIIIPPSDITPTTPSTNIHH